MPTEISIQVTPKQASSDNLYISIVAQKLKINPNRIVSHQIIGRSIDARGGKVKINLRLLIHIDEITETEQYTLPEYKKVNNSTPVAIIGAGPAGLFAALKLIELGLKPIIIERGKDVHSRKKDISNIHNNIEVNSESNYSFGEGGAGTYSDGKLFTRSKKRGNIKEVLHILHSNGASENILIDSHPHIGSNKLPEIIENIRETILNFGGEIHFNTCCTELLIKESSISGIKTKNGDKIDTKAVILATGHSARDIYYMLSKQNITLEAKPFAMGVRIEHPQELIDSIQYSCKTREPYLPAASYSLVQQVANRGVYSFCMCPGGVIVPASTSNNEMVVNGMSPSNRNTMFANSGMVVEIQLTDIEATKNKELTGLNFQKHYEELSFKYGGQGQIAPAQRMTDFVNGKTSQNLPKSSFKPGIISSPMHEWIPDIISNKLQEAFKSFNKKMKGYLTSEATLIGVESRTSSPIRIPRDNETMQHPEIKGLFPSGEGAGYAGGIVSSAIDGQLSANKVFEMLSK